MKLNAVRVALGTPAATNKKKEVKREKSMVFFVRKVCLLLFFVIGVGATLSAAPRKDKKQKVATGALSPQEMHRYNSFFLEGVVQREAGHDDAALELFEHAHRIYPAGGETMFELAQLYENLFDNRASDIYRLLSKAVASDSTNFYYQSAFADLLARSDSTHAEAIALYEQMSRRFPSQTELLPRLADLYNVEQQPDGVLRVLERMEINEGKSEDLSVEKAKLYIQMGDSVKAINEMKELCASNPYDQEVRISLADIYMNFNEVDSATVIYQSILKQEPDNGNALLRMLFRYRDTHNVPLYEETLKALVYAPAQPAPLKIQAMSVELRRIKNESADSIARTTQFLRNVLSVPDSDNAFVEFVLNALPGTCVPADSAKVFRQMVLHRYPNSLATRYVLLNEALNSLDYARVVRLCAEGVVYNPEVLAFYYYGGISLYKMNKLQDCAKLLLEGEAMIGNDDPADLVSDYYGTLADVLRELNRKTDSYAAFEKAIAIKSDNVLCLNNYAYYLSIDNYNLDKAEEMAEKAIQLEPKNAIYLDTYAWVLFVKGETEKAKIYIDEMLLCLEADNPEDADVIEHAGDIYAACGRIDEAIAFWNKAIKLGSSSKNIKEKIKFKKYIAP